jgi:hypothetical protein
MSWEWHNLISTLLFSNEKNNKVYGHMKADKQLIRTDDAGHKCDIVINNIH